jgi:hypothetical protein
LSVGLALLISAAILHPATAIALEDVVLAAPEESWLAEHLQTVRRTRSNPAGTYGLTGATIWSRGLKEPARPSSTAPSEKAMGARIRPFREMDLTVGTQMARSGDAERVLRSEVNWQMSWSRELDSLEGVQLGFTTLGAVESLHGAYTQSLEGSLGVPVLQDRGLGETKLKVSPRLAYDALAGTWRPSLAPEIVNDTMLTGAAAPFRSVLSLRLGSDLAPDARPSATARVELRFSTRQ